MHLSAGELKIGKMYLTGGKGKVVLLEAVPELHPLGVPTKGMEVWLVRRLEDGEELLEFTFNFLEEVNA